MNHGKKLKLIECSGTPYEIGRQWGEGCRESIRTVSENIRSCMALYYQASQEDILVNAMKYFQAVQAFDPYLVEIMQGQAAATGLRFEEIFAQKCFNELMFNYGSISGLCTSFAATGEATKDGKTILGQNIDFLSDAPIDLLKIRHSDGLQQYVLSFSNSSEFTFSSAGFGMCANATIGKNYAFGVPVGCYLPRVMRAASMDDALTILKTVARGLGYYHLADAGGKMFGIEGVHNDFELRYPERGMLLHSNHYLTERFREEDTAAQLQPDSFHRIERIRGLMESHYGALDVETIQQILADHDQHPYSICRHVDPAAPVSSVTLASFIMIPEEGVIHIAAGNPCECEYVQYGF